MQENFVPVLNGFVEKKRLKQLSHKFETVFDQTVDYYIRVPGRINLIGEHIDYCGYSVLPMATDQDILFAVSKTCNQLIKISNYEHELYPQFSCSSNQININRPPCWHDYVLCGLKGFLDKDKENTLSGLNIMVWGVIPPASGLSSSSALVCGSFLSALYSNSDKTSSIDKCDVASRAANCERYVGTQGGAMDHSIAMLAKKEFAKLIEFDPTLSAQDVSLPRGVSFFVSHCGVSHQKAAHHLFNIRVFETRVAALIIAKKYNLLKSMDESSFLKLGRVQKALKKSPKEMVDIINTLFVPEKAYTVDEIIQLLEVKRLDELEDIVTNGCKTTTEKLKNILNLKTSAFKLHSRAMHVYQEVARVEDFVQLCKLSQVQGDVNGDQDLLHSLGNLMNQSHESCKYLYECSCDELDELVAVARKNGALGSRLTGAGWGGCVVSMVPDHLESQFCEKLKDYSKFTFKSNPSQGANIFTTKMDN